MSYSLVAISSFCQTGSGTTPSRKEADFYGGDIPWIKSGELRENEILGSEEFVTEKALRTTSLKKIPAGSILVAMYGATVGRVGILGIDATTNQAVCHIIPDKRQADTRYMFHALKHKAAELVSRGVGGAQPNISQGVIKETKIPLPPVAEQKRIARILDQADSLRRLRQRAIDRLNTLGQAIFYEMFGGNEAVYSIGELIDDGVIIYHKDGNHGSNYPQREDFGDEGVAFISAKDLDEFGRIGDSVSRLADSKARRLTIGWLEPDDVLLAHNASVGKVGVYDGKFGQALIGTSLTAFRCDKGILNPFFLAATFRQRDFQNQLFSNMAQTTRNQVPITAQKRLRVILPDLFRQKKFAYRLNAISTQTEIFVHSDEKLFQLFSSLQDRAFRGAL